MDENVDGRGVMGQDGRQRMLLVVCGHNKRSRGGLPVIRPVRLCTYVENSCGRGLRAQRAQDERLHGRGGRTSASACAARGAH